VTDEAELIQQLRGLMDRAKKLTDRSQTLAARLEGLSEPLHFPDGSQHLDGLRKIREALAQVSSEGLGQSRISTLEVHPAVHELVGFAAVLQNEVTGLELRSDTVADGIVEAEHEIRARVDHVIANIEQLYVSTRDKIDNATTETFNRLKGEFTHVDERVKSVFDQLQHSMGSAESEITRITTTLKEARNDVLAACRAAGIGAQAAARTVQTLTSVFSEVDS
jgi:hypothetical protein